MQGAAHTRGNARMTANQLISTHIEGLDNVLHGGLIHGGFYLFQGDPGSGKTTLALQIVQGRARAGDRCLYVSLTETRRDIESTCASHGWKLEGLELLDLTRPSPTLDGPEPSIFHPADTELADVIDRVRAEVERVDPQFIVFDGLSELRLLAGDPLPYRRQLLTMKEFFATRGATVILLDDRSSSFRDIQPESLVGGSIVLEKLLPTYGRARRRLHVGKVRGGQFREGYHDYEIVTGGVRVHPRLVAGEHHGTVDGAIWRSGVDNLDHMLGGGLSSGSTTLLLGPAGAGKSTIALQYVVNALRNGSKAAIYVFDEVMHILVDRAEKLCFANAGGFEGYVADGKLHAQQVDPAEMSPGAFANEVRRAVDAGARMVVIDSLNGYLNAMTEERFLATHLHELFAYLNQKGVLTLIIAGQHGMLASAGAATDMDVSYLADTVILFRYYEAAGAVHPAIGALKKRTGPHERTIRDLQIDARGVTVGEPLRHFRGIMTGVPQYDVLAHAGQKPPGTASAGHDGAT